MCTAAGFSLAYVVGATVSMGQLGRRIGGMPRWPLVRYVLRLLVPATVGALAAYAVTTVLDRPLDGLAGWLGDLVGLAARSTVSLLLYVALGYLMRITAIRRSRDGDPPQGPASTAWRGVRQGLSRRPAGRG